MSGLDFAEGNWEKGRRCYTLTTSVIDPLYPPAPLQERDIHLTSCVRATALAYWPPNYTARTRHLQTSHPPILPTSELYSPSALPHHRSCSIIDPSYLRAQPNTSAALPKSLKTKSSTTYLHRILTDIPPLLRPRCRHILNVLPYSPRGHVPQLV